MTLWRRLITIAGAYIAASLVAGVPLAMALVYRPGTEWGPVDLGLLQITVLFVGMVSSFVAGLALIPALVAGIYAERAGIRSPLFYALAGMAIGLVAIVIYVAVLMWSGAPSDGFSFGEGDVALAVGIAGAVMVVVVAGLAAGLTYWAIAGRSAGVRSHATIAS